MDNRPLILKNIIVLIWSVNETKRLNILKEPVVTDAAGLFACIIIKSCSSISETGLFVVLGDGLLQDA